MSIQSKAALSRKMVEHSCAGCGRPFKGIRIRRYHSRACQVQAYRRRQKGKRLKEEVLA